MALAQESAWRSILLQISSQLQVEAGVEDDVEENLFCVTHAATARFWLYLHYVGTIFARVPYQV